MESFSGKILHKAYLNSVRRSMATGYALSPPPALEIHSPNAADKWKKFFLAWDNYALATELAKKDEGVQVATLLTVIGEEAREVYSTFNDWEKDGDDKKIKPVLKKFGEYCEPRKNIPFERFKFNRRMQEPGETYDLYRTALRKLADSCNFEEITPEEILRDRLVFGIRDSKVRERLLRETKLTLEKTYEICRASESMLAQMKIVGNGEGQTVNAVNRGNKTKSPVANRQREKTHGGKHANCGTEHDYTKKELCPAYLKTCLKCGKLSHFRAKCRSKRKDTKDTKDNGHRKSIRAVDNPDSDSEVFYATNISAIELDDSQLVTLKLSSGNYLRFQPGTGAQCNVIPVELYKKAAKDYKLEHVTPLNTQLTAYGGSKLTVVGQVRIRVWRDDFKCLLDCNLVESNVIRPLLGKRLVLA